MNAIARHWDIVRSALEDERARATAVLKVNETAFLPAALEVIERPVSPTARWTARLLLLALVMTIAWTVFGEIDVVASARGRLIPADNVKLVQSAEAGVVRAILVRDGQRVRKGQVLVELDPTVSGAEATQARRALETAELDGARLRAILSALDGSKLNFVPPLATPPDMVELQVGLARAQLAEIEAGASGHYAGQQASLAAHGEARIQAAKLSETLPLLDQQIEANERLLEKGYVSKLKVIEMRRQRLAAARDLDIALETIKRAGAQTAAAGSGADENRAQARAELIMELTRAEADAKLRREELVKARQRSSLQRLTSPIDGTVAQLAVHTVGGVIEPAKPIMIVVPSDGLLVLQAQVLNKDIGFISPGQVVAVKLDAFPFTRFGSIRGLIESVGSDAVEDERLGLVYSVRIRLGGSTIDRRDKTVPLNPGMTATADIKTGKRSIASYLFSPINEARQEAARER